LGTPSKRGRPCRRQPVGLEHRLQGWGTPYTPLPPGWWVVGAVHRCPQVSGGQAAPNSAGEVQQVQWHPTAPARRVPQRRQRSALEEGTERGAVDQPPDGIENRQVPSSRGKKAGKVGTVGRGPRGPRARSFDGTARLRETASTDLQALAAEHTHEAPQGGQEGAYLSKEGARCLFGLLHVQEGAPVEGGHSHLTLMT